MADDEPIWGHVDRVSPAGGSVPGISQWIYTSTNTEDPHGVEKVGIVVINPDQDSTILAVGAYGVKETEAALLTNVDIGFVPRDARRSLGREVHHLTGYGLSSPTTFSHWPDINEFLLPHTGERTNIFHRLFPDWKTPGQKGVDGVLDVFRRSDFLSAQQEIREKICDIIERGFIKQQSIEQSDNAMLNQLSATTRKVLGR